MIFITFILSVVVGDVFLELVGFLELLDQNIREGSLVEPVAEGTGDLVPLKPKGVHLLVAHPL